jgi:hypothetical protein
MDVEEAIEKGIRFLEEKAGHYTHTLESVRLDGGVWILRFDVGFLEERKVEVKISDDTGRLVSYERFK